MRIKAVGRIGSGFKLLLAYKPRPDHARSKTEEVHSNNLAYGKTWPTREEITAAHALAFRKWVEGGLKPSILGGSKSRELSVQPATRVSERLEEGQARQLSPLRMTTLGDGAVDSPAAAATSAASAAVAATLAANMAATAADVNAAARQERLEHDRLPSWGDHALHAAAEDTAAAASTAAEAATAAAAAAQPAASVPFVHPEIWRCVEWLKTKLVHRARAQAGKVRAEAQAMMARVKRQLSGVAVLRAKRQKLNWGTHRKASNRWQGRNIKRRGEKSKERRNLPLVPCRWALPRLVAPVFLISVRAQPYCLECGPCP